MKKLCLALIFIMCTFTAVWAESQSNSESEFWPVESYDFGLDVSLKDGSVYLEWEAYTEEDFKWYKILKSETNTQPVYPDDHVEHIFVESEVDQAWEKPRPGTFYYRVCVVTQENARLCWDVVLLELDKEDIYDAGADKNEYEKKDDYEDKKYEWDEYEKKEAKEVIKQKYADKKEIKHAQLNSKTKTRLKNFVSSFEAKLEKSDLTDTQKSDKIESIIIKLENLADKKPKLADMIEYIIDSLTQLQAEYSDDLDEIEALFEL